MRAAIVIPAYNEAATIRGVALRAVAEVPAVYVVDDGSTDGTAAALAGVPVTVLTHARNEGKAASLWDGFAAALASGVDVVVTLDGDGQHRPEDVSRLLAAAEQHPHRLVIGARLRGRSAAPAARRWANGIADFWLSWAAGHRIADSQSGQRAYPAALLRDMLAANLRHDAGASFTLESELLIEAAARGCTTIAVPIDTVYHVGARRSHFRPARDIARIVRMVAARLVAANLNLPGLWHAVAGTPLVVDTGSTIVRA